MLDRLECLDILSIVMPDRKMIWYQNGKEGRDGRVCDLYHRELWPYEPSEAVH